MILNTVGPPNSSRICCTFMDWKLWVSVLLKGMISNPKSGTDSRNLEIKVTKCSSEQSKSCNWGQLVRQSDNFPIVFVMKPWSFPIDGNSSTFSVSVLVCLLWPTKCGRSNLVSVAGSGFQGSFNFFYSKEPHQPVRKIEQE